MESTLHIAIVSNIIFEPYFNPMIKSYFEGNIKIYPIPYGEHKNETYQKQLVETDLIIIWLNLEALFPDCFHTETQQNLDRPLRKLSFRETS